MPEYWTVNQGKTYKDEIPGGFLWAPLTNKIGSKLQIYTNLTLIKKGDIVFSLVNLGKGQCIYAIGTCVKEYSLCDNPLKHNKNDWIKEGWIVNVDFKELDSKAYIKDNFNIIRPLLPKKYSPLLQNGNAPQQGYLSYISEELAKIFINIIGNEFTIGSLNEELEEEGICGRTDIGFTVKRQLVNSRRGQGIFKENVLKNEKSCRVTGITDIKFLTASHIKPWAKSTDSEKLDGCNGLLLSPNVDRLFDKGFISFGFDGSIMVSKQVDTATLIALGVNKDVNVGNFNKNQCSYLDYHQKNIFKK
jgi:putative restriction endonuclease